MSRALGDLVAQSVGVTAEPEINITELEDEDEWLILASDGLWEFVSTDEAASIVRLTASAEEACSELVEHASKRWKEANEGLMDDISVVVTKFQPRRKKY